jgi:hypothetical protein
VFEKIIPTAQRRAITRVLEELPHETDDAGELVRLTDELDMVNAKTLFAPRPTSQRWTMLLPGIFAAMVWATLTVRPVMSAADFLGLGVGFALFGLNLWGWRWEKRRFTASRKLLLRIAAIETLPRAKPQLRIDASIEDRRA